MAVTFDIRSMRRGPVPHVPGGMPSLTSKKRKANGEPVKWEDVKTPVTIGGITVGVLVILGIIWFISEA